jgi:hypothetical protein
VHHAQRFGSEPRDADRCKAPVGVQGEGIRKDCDSSESRAVEGGVNGRHVLNEMTGGRGKPRKTTAFEVGAVSVSAPLPFTLFPLLP